MEISLDSHGKVYEERMAQQGQFVPNRWSRPVSTRSQFGENRGSLEIVVLGA